MEKVDEKKFSNFMFREGSVISQAYNPKLFNKKIIEYEVEGKKVSTTIYEKNSITIDKIEADSLTSRGNLKGPFTITYSDGSTETKETQSKFLEKLEVSKTPNWYKEFGKSYDKIEKYSASYDDNGNLLGLYPESYNIYLKIKEHSNSNEEAKHNLALKKRGKAIIALTAAIAILAAGAGHHIAKLINASQSKDNIINDKDQIINDKDEIIENELQTEDRTAFKGFLENKLGGKVLLYADDEGMTGSMRVYFEKDGNLCMKSYKLPEGINDFDGFNRPSLEQFKKDINSDKVEVFDEFSFSKTEKREISVNGVTYNLNGMTDASDITKNLLTINEGESSENYIERCNRASVVISDPIIVNQYDNQKNIIGKKVIVNAFVGSQDETVDAKMIQKEKYYSEAEVANMSKADLIAKTLEEGRFVELENSNGYNFLPRLTIVSATNDIKDSINDYTDPQEIKKLNIELQSAGIIKIGESVVSKVAESGDIKYLRITDLAKRDCLYAVKYTNIKPVSAEKYISLNNYTANADARDVLMYSLTGNFFDRFGSEDKTMYVKSSISTNSSNEYNGKLDIVCVGYSSDNPIAMEKKGLVEVKSNDKLNIQKLVDVVIAKINNEKCPVKGTIKYSLTGAQAIKNEEDLVEIDGQVMTTKELTNFLIDERII